jgi:hypothetical protein
MMQGRYSLVWVRGIAGPPQPQISSPEAFHISQSRIDASVVAIHELTDEERRLPLRTIAKMHPPARD